MLIAIAILIPYVLIDISVEYAEMDVWFIPFPRIINYSVCK